MTKPILASLDARRRRLLYRATHRGTYETDILFGGFVQRHITSMHDSELEALEALLHIPDNDLADWLTGRLPIPAALEMPILGRIREWVATHSPAPCGGGIGGGGAPYGDLATSPKLPPARGGGARDGG